MKKNNRSIFVWAFIGFIIFLAVPFLFHDEETTKKNNFSIDSEGDLPIINAQSPLSKYFSKLQKFYGIKKNTNGPAPAKQALARISESNKIDAADNSEVQQQEGQQLAVDSIIKEEGIEAVRNSFNKNPDLFLGKDIIKTKSGAELIATSKGYMHNGQYYDYGTYPDFKYKKEIENALGKYHKNMAGKLGLNAAYIKDDDGSLRVEYLDKAALDKAQNETLLASAKMSGNERYKDMKIVSKNGSGGSFLGNLFGKEKDEDKKSSLGKANLTNMDEMYDSLRSKLATYSSSGKNGQEQNNEEEKSAGQKSFSAEILEVSGEVPVEAIGRTGEALSSTNAEQYKGAPILVIENGKMSLRNLLAKYGIKEEIKGEEITNFTVPVSDIEDLRNRKLMKEISDKLKEKVEKERSAEDGKIKVVSVSRIPRPLEQVSSEINNAYKAFPRTPFVNVLENGQPDDMAFSEVFLKQSGMQDLFDAVGVSQSDLLNLEMKYIDLDARRLKNKQYYDLLESDPKLQKRMPKIVFYLGKVPNGVANSSNLVAIASPSSFLYSYAPSMAPDFVIRNREDNQRLVERMSPVAFLENVNAKGSNNIVVVNDEAVAGVLRKNGVKTVRVIDSDTLYSGTPESIGKVLDNLSVMINDKINADKGLKQEFISSIKQINEMENQN